MKVYIAPFPQIAMKESDDFTALATANMPIIKQRYGDIINAACAAYGTDPIMMQGFIAIESPDLTDDAVSAAGAVGLIQMQPATAFDFLCKQAPQMPAGYGVVVEKYLPGFLKPGGFTGFWSSWKDQVKSALFYPDFNLWTGITGLSQMVWADIKKNDGTLRLDHVVIKYNAGGDDYSGNYHKYVVAPGLENADPITLLNSLPLVETKAYIIKLLGIDGSIIVALRNS